MAKNKEEIIDLEGEEWRDVHVIKGVNFFGYYQISNKGRMKALDRHYYDKLGRKGFHHGGIMSPSKNSKGYLSVVLIVNGVWRSVLIHRVVAEEFIPNPNNLPCVNHKDENPLNNCVENLEWCDYQYNNTYGTIQERVTATLKEFNSYKNPPLMKLDLEGNIINVYHSTDSFKFDNPDVSMRTVSGSIKSGRHISKGVFWIRLDEYNQMNHDELISFINSKVQELNDAKERRAIATSKAKSVPIVQLDLDGNFIREWESTTEAKREKFQHSDIRSCVCKRQKTAGGFKWMYLSEYEELNK